MYYAVQCTYTVYSVDDNVKRREIQCMIVVHHDHKDIISLTKECAYISLGDYELHQLNCDRC